MLKSEIEAEEFEKKAKEELKSKNYDLSKTLFEKARDIYLQLNYMGKVNVIEKQIAQINRVINYEKRAKTPVVQQSSSFIQEKIEEKPINIPEMIKTQKMAEEEIQVKTPTDSKQQILSDAELRRAKLREQLTQREKEAELKWVQDTKIKEREKIKRQEIARKDKEYKVTTEKENQKEFLIKNAEKAMDRAKLALDNKNFSEAKAFYKEALDIFKTLGWFDQVDILYREIQHVEIYKTDYLKKISFEDQKRLKREELFQKRVDSLLEEQNQKKKLIRADLMKLPPEIKKIIDKINLLLEKAEKEVNAHIYERALNRYQYILELYNSIPPEKLNLKDEIAEITKKIDDMKAKL